MSNRREFVCRSLSYLSLPLVSSLVATNCSGAETAKRPLIISTWPFGKNANDKALQTIQAGGTTLDAVEQGIRLTEDSGNLSVGLSGKPNAAGFAQLDACIMHGPGHQGGSVCAIEGVLHPITAARRVMEKTPHVMMAGRGARSFAISEGLKTFPITDHDKKSDTWWKNRREVNPQEVNANNHDTIALLVLGADGTISGGCSTSGLSDKLPGRVGDSPILGSGLYVDNEVGAAGATGIGENVMRYCGSFLVVEYMRAGLSPQAACEKVIDRIRAKEPAGRNPGINFVALDKKGRFGAAGTDDFPHSVTYPGVSTVITVPAYRSTTTDN